METQALLHLNMGSYLKAFKFAEIILHQPGYKKSINAIYVLSQALFNLCDFEHALIMFHKGKRLSPHSNIFIEGVRKCEECINKMLSSPKCFDNINLFLVGDKLGKFGFYQKRKKQMFNRKTLVMDKFKNYGKEKEMKRNQLAGVGTKVKGKVEDPLKEDKVFLKKLATEFTQQSLRYWLEYASLSTS